MPPLLYPERILGSRDAQISIWTQQTQMSASIWTHAKKGNWYANYKFSEYLPKKYNSCHNCSFHFVYSEFSGFRTARVGLQNDAKRDFARRTWRNPETMCRAWCSKWRANANEISTFFPTSVTVRHCEFSGKDDTGEEFLDFEVPSS